MESHYSNPEPSQDIQPLYIQRAGYYMFGDNNPYWSRVFNHKGSFMATKPTAKTKKSASLYIEGGSRPEPIVREDENPRALGLGTSVLYWHGDDGVLGTIVGGVPAGYISRPLYKEWIRGVHSTGTLSYGPYQRLDGVGSFKVWFFVEITNRGAAGDEVLKADVVDYDNNGSALASATFRVSDFPAGTETFCIYSQGLGIPRGNHRIESRIIASGGASLKLWGIRWEIDTL